MVTKNPFQRDEDEFASLKQYAMGATTPKAAAPAQLPAAPAPQPAPAASQPTQLSQPVNQIVPQPAQQPQPMAAPAPKAPAAPAQQPQFGQPQQPQPVQPRQTTMTQNTAAQRYNQMIQQNAPQAQAVSSGLAQVIQNPAVEAQKSLDAAQREFQTKVRDSGLTRTSGRTSDLISKAARGEALSEEELAELQNIATTKDTFGEDVRDSDFVALQDYVNALGRADEAKQMASLASDNTGRQELLRGLVDNAQYTEGQSLLDSLLAGGTQASAQQLEDVKKDLVTDDRLGAAATAAQARAGDIRGQEQEEIDLAYKDIQDFLDAKEAGNLSGQEQAIRDRVVAENKRATELNTQIDKVLTNKGAKFGDTDEERSLISTLGLSDADIKLIERAGPNARADIINRLKEATEQTMTSEEELDRLAELYKIGDIVKRDAPKIQAQQGEDLGSTINQKAGVNFPAIESAITENRDTAEAKAAELREAALQEPVSNYKLANNLPAKDAAKHIYNTLLTGKFKPGRDNIEADKVINALMQPVNEAKTFYESVGLPFPVKNFEPSTNEVNEELVRLWNTSDHMPRQAKTKMTVKDIPNLVRSNPKIYADMQDSAIRLAKIKKLAEFNNFANELPKGR